MGLEILEFYDYMDAQCYTISFDEETWIEVSVVDHGGGVKSMTMSDKVTEEQVQMLWWLVEY